MNKKGMKEELRKTGSSLRGWKRGIDEAKNSPWTQPVSCHDVKGPWDARNVGHL